MDVQILSTEMIKPLTPTPPHLKKFNLSFFDQIVAPFYIPITLFYNTKFHPSNIPEIHSHLKKSLSQTLTIFYPLAGRIQNLSTVDCNDEGVLYTEATTRFTLSEFLQKPDLNSLNKFLPRNANTLDFGFEIQMSIQATVFSCGGLVIGVCLYHRLADATMLSCFLKTWADFFRGKHDKHVVNNHQNLALGSSLFPALSSFPDDYETNHVKLFFYNGTNLSLTRRFVFDASSIATLKAKATSESVPNPTSVEVLTCFVCQRLMTGLTSRSKTRALSLMILIMMNIRRRLDPPLPGDAFGNFLWMAAAFYSPSETKMELPDCVAELREAVEGINGESLRELEPENAIRDITESQQVVKENDEMKEYKFTSWRNMGLYELDFGWGRPAWVAHMGDAAAGGGGVSHQFMFIEGKNGGEIELWVLLGEEEIGVLENDGEFGAFATSNPSVSF